MHEVFSSMPQPGTKGRVGTVPNGTTTGGPKPGGPKTGGPKTGGLTTGGTKTGGPKTGGPKTGGPTTVGTPESTKTPEGTGPTLGLLFMINAVGFWGRR